MSVTSNCSDDQSYARLAKPKVGIGFRLPIRKQTRLNLEKFDVLEITIDHYIKGGETARQAIAKVADRIDLVAHGVGLSIGTDAPLDFAYLDQVAESIETLGIPSYSEHLAWTKTLDTDLANLLPLPRTIQVAELIIDKVHQVQKHVPVPFQLENISLAFEFPGSTMSDAEFFNLILCETGAGMLLDVENLYVNYRNHGRDPYQFIDALPEHVVHGIHTAGGPTLTRDYLDEPFWADNHSASVPDEALDLLDYALQRQRPETVILERDNDVQKFDEILEDISRIRDRIERREMAHVEPT